MRPSPSQNGSLTKILHSTAHKCKSVYYQRIEYTPYQCVFWLWRTSAHLERMTWKTVRLELARTKDFPNGSAGRAYLMRLPLDGHGVIDETEFTANPQFATVRRYWPNEADRAGYLIRRKKGWAFSYAIGDEDDEDIFHLESHPIALGEYLTITETDRTRLPFRVMRCDG